MKDPLLKRIKEAKRIREKTTKRLLKEYQEKGFWQSEEWKRMKEEAKRNSEYLEEE